MRRTPIGLLTAMAVFAGGSEPSGATTDGNPLSMLLGSWGGSGQISLEGNRTARIKCDAYYTGGGGQLNMAVRCAGEDNKIEMRSKLTYSGGKLTGSWEERTYHAEGNVSGEVGDERLTLNISGGISGAMTVSFNRSRQDVSIRTEGIPLKSVKIGLSRK
jgi:hypothetical protein